MNNYNADIIAYDKGMAWYIVFKNGIDGESCTSLYCKKNKGKDELCRKCPVWGLEKLVGEYGLVCGDDL